MRMSICCGLSPVACNTASTAPKMTSSDSSVAVWMLTLVGVDLRAAQVCVCVCVCVCARVHGAGVFEWWVCLLACLVP
jgi:hypothetical protein